MRLNWIFCLCWSPSCRSQRERWSVRRWSVRRWEWDGRLNLTGPLTLRLGAHVQAVPLQLCHFLQQTAAQQEMGSGVFGARELSIETQTTSTSISNYGIVSVLGMFRPIKKLLELVVTGRICGLFHIFSADLKGTLWNAFKFCPWRLVIIYVVRL